MSGQTVGYIRVSTTEQNPDRQLVVIGNVDETFTDRVSGKSRADRPAKGISTTSLSKRRAEGAARQHRLPCLSPQPAAFNENLLQGRLDGASQHDSGSAAESHWVKTSSARAPESHLPFAMPSIFLLGDRIGHRHAAPPRLSVFDCETARPLFPSTPHHVDGQQLGPCRRSSTLYA